MHKTIRNLGRLSLWAVEVWIGPLGNELIWDGIEVIEGVKILA